MCSGITITRPVYPLKDLCGSPVLPKHDQRYDCALLTWNLPYITLLIGSSASFELEWPPLRLSPSVRKTHNSSWSACVVIVRCAVKLAGTSFDKLASYQTKYELSTRAAFLVGCIGLSVQSEASVPCWLVDPALVIRASLPWNSSKFAAFA